MVVGYQHFRNPAYLPHSLDPGPLFPPKRFGETGKHLGGLDRKFGSHTSRSPARDDCRGGIAMVWHAVLDQVGEGPVVGKGGKP